MADAVKKYVKEKRLPAGYRFSTWDDTSIEVRERMDLLLRNGMQGLILVFQSRSARGAADRASQAAPSAG